MAAGTAWREIFGSAARGTDFDPATSDADFLAEFDPSREHTTFKELVDFENALAAALGREVDVLSDLPRNKCLLASINECREIVYEA
ncbi:MAG: nucleotidyltransferase domain-containing protein [Boseongicola sp.]|nr:nucleotidyltransferase domain-containing protein [Boseongicola sp.]